MAKKPREMLKSFMNGLKETEKTNQEHITAFMNMLGSFYKEGSISVKVKELISIAIAVYARCEYCIVYHVYNALEAGATREEMMEAAMVAAAFGGGPSMTYSVTLLKDSIDEFEDDVKK